MSFSIDLIVIVLLNNFCHRFHILSSFIFWLRQVRGYQNGKKASGFSNIYPLPSYHACRIRWSDFWKNWTHFILCQNSKISLWNVAFWLGAGPLKMLTVTLKLSIFYIFFYILKGCTWSKMCSLVSLKAKK